MIRMLLVSATRCCGMVSHGTPTTARSMKRAKVRSEAVLVPLCYFFVKEDKAHLQHWAAVKGKIDQLNRVVVMETSRIHIIYMTVLCSFTVLPGMLF